MNPTTRAKTLLSKLDECPPFVVYYLARTSKASGAHPRPHGIAALSGLSIRTVTRLSQQMTWAGVKLAVMEAFCLGCGVNFLKVSGQWNYLQRPHYDYIWHLQRGHYKHPLRHLTKEQRPKFLKLCQKWADVKSGP